MSPENMDGIVSSFNKSATKVADKSIQTDDYTIKELYGMIAAKKAKIEFQQSLPKQQISNAVVHIKNDSKIVAPRPCTSSETIEPLNLTSINDDCKMRIFEYLEFTDLLNIADTSKQLHRAVHEVFKRKYGNARFMNFHQIKHDYRKMSYEYTKSIYEENLFVWSPLLILKVLRNFGHIFSKIWLGDDDRRDSIQFHIEYYVAEYCSKTLSKLELGRPKFLFNTIHVPFISVESIELWQISSLNVNDIEINKYFPNMQYLKLNLHSCDSFVFPLNRIVTRFPCLKHLIIRVGYNYEREIAQLLRLNPQLTKLELWTDSTMAVYRMKVTVF